MLKKESESIIRPLVYFSPFIFPLYLIRFQVAGIPFTILELYTYLLFGLWFLAKVFGQMDLVWNKKVRIYLIPVLLLLLGVTLGAFFAPEILPSPGGDIPARRVAWGIWKGWIVAPMLYFWVLIQTLRTSDQIKKTLNYFIYSGAVLVLVSYVFGIFAEGFSYDFRLKGVFENANFLALYIVPSFLLATCFLFDRKKKASSQIYLNTIAWIILGHGLFFTKSYGAFLGVFGALGLYALVILIKRPKWRKKLMLGLSLLLILFLGLLITQWNTPKFQQALDFEGRSSSSVRMEIYTTAIDLIKNHPVLGIGPGLFQPSYQNQAPESLNRLPMEWNMPHSHNIFLAFWLNAGLLGFLSLLLFLILVHQRFTYALIPFWGILIHGLFDVPFWKNDLAMIFWLMLGSILIIQMNKK